MQHRHFWERQSVYSFHVNVDWATILQLNPVLMPVQGVLFWLYLYKLRFLGLSPVSSDSQRYLLISLRCDQLQLLSVFFQDLALNFSVSYGRIYLNLNIGPARYAIK